jgi:cytochrome c
MKFSALARVATAAGVFATLAFVPAFAADKTRDDVVGIVKRTVVYLQANGPDKSYAEFSNPKGSFVDGELYMSVYDLKGDCLAHGADASKVGKDLSSAKDADGKLYVQERVTLAATQASFWQTYKATDPVTKAPVERDAYCERSAGVLVCSGINKH